MSELFEQRFTDVFFSIDSNFDDSVLTGTLCYKFFTTISNSSGIIIDLQMMRYYLCVNTVMPVPLFTNFTIGCITCVVFIALTSGVKVNSLHIVN